MTEQQKMLQALELIRSDILGGRCNFLCAITNDPQTEEVTVRAFGKADPKKLIKAMLAGAYRTLRS